MNNTLKKISAKEPIKAIELANIELEEKNYERPVGFDEERLPSFVKVRYLYAPGEEEGGIFRIATDPIWSNKDFDLELSLVSKDQTVLYFLVDGPKKGFVREELQVIPEDT